MNDVYARITDRIIAELEKGCRPWTPNWDTGFVRPRRANGLPYRGINVVMLWSEASRKGFRSPTWMTFRQALELGAHVRFGETGSLVVYANQITRKVEGDAGEETAELIPFLRGYTVFNTEQIEGLPQQYYNEPQPRLGPAERIERADRFFANTGATINEGPQPCYVINQDKIRIPPIELFEDAQSYYATLGHETVHWSGHPSRLGRDLGRRFGDGAYAVEELVAELGAAFLAADLELSCEPRPDHASYIGGWLKVLRADKRAIFTAASQAQRAADYLWQLQPAVSPEGQMARAG
jgi:antirestriction protein ArdC